MKYLQRDLQVIMLWTIVHGCIIRIEKGLSIVIIYLKISRLRVSLTTLVKNRTGKKKCLL